MAKTQQQIRGIEERYSRKTYNCQCQQADCKEIVTYSHNWSEIFDKLITRPEEVGLANKEQKTEWISMMSKEINKISKASYSVPKTTFELISSIYEWLIVEK